MLHLELLTQKICANCFKELCARFITSPVLVRWQRFIARIRNMCGLFLFNCGISYFYAACHIDDLSRGSILGMKFTQITSDWFVLQLLAKSCVLVCVFHQFQWPWRPQGQYGAVTCPMAAPSGFKWSPGCAPLGNVPHIILPHPHDNQSCQQFACIFVFNDFIVGHNHS